MQWLAEFMADISTSWVRCCTSDIQTKWSRSLSNSWQPRKRIMVGPAVMLKSSKHACPLELRCGRGLLQLNCSWEARTQRLSRAATLVGHSLWRCSVGRRKTGHVVEMCCDKEAAASEEAVTRQDEDEEGFKGQNSAAIGNAGPAMARGIAR